jgi:imidazolonepropionase-like amidohydrolase
MELLMESGLSPMAVIRASTIDNARFLGCADRLGSIEAGKLADLVLVEGDPLENMRAMYNLRHVMLNGRWIEGPKRGARP